MKPNEIVKFTRTIAKRLKIKTPRVSFAYRNNGLADLKGYQIIYPRQLVLYPIVYQMYYIVHELVHFITGAAHDFKFRCVELYLLRKLNIKPVYNGIYISHLYNLAGEKLYTFNG